MSGRTSGTEPDVIGGGPEPGSPLGDRQKRFLQLLGAVVLIGILSIRISSLLNWAWLSENIGHDLVIGLVSNNREFDTVVIFSLSTIGGWFALFEVDRTKRLQRWLALTVALVIIVWLAVFQNRLFEGVAWGELWWVSVLGLLCGLGSGAGPQLIEGRRWGEFPVAAVVLFSCLVLATLLAYVDVYVLAGGQVPEAASQFLPGPQTIAGKLIDIVAVVGFILMSGWFILYSDYRSVALFSDNKDVSLAVMAGLFDHVEANFPFESGRGGTSLQSATGPLSNGRRPNGSSGDRMLEFSYLPPRQVSRWVVVSTAQIDINQFSDRELDTLATKVRDQGLFQTIFSVLNQKFIPNRVSHKLLPDTRLLVDRVSEADVVILTVSAREVSAQSPVINRFTSICESLPRSVTKIIVVTDAEHAKAEYEETRNESIEDITDDHFRQFVSGHILDVDRDYLVVTVSWSTNETGAELVAGIEDLREAIDGDS